MNDRWGRISIVCYLVAIALPIGCSLLQAWSSTALHQVLEIEQASPQEMSISISAALSTWLPADVRSELLSLDTLLERVQFPGQDTGKSSAVQADIQRRLRLAKEAAAARVRAATLLAYLVWLLAIVIGAAGILCHLLSRASVRNAVQVPGAEGEESPGAEPLRSAVTAFAALADITDGALIARGGKVEWVNPAFCRITGLDAQHLIGQEIATLHPILGSGALGGTGEESISTRFSRQERSTTRSYVVEQSAIRDAAGEPEPDSHVLLLHPLAVEEANPSAEEYCRTIGEIYRQLADSVTAAEVEVGNSAQLRAALHEADALRSQAAVIIDICETYERLAIDEDMPERVRALASAAIEDERFNNLVRVAEKARESLDLEEAMDLYDDLAENISEISECIRSLRLVAALNDS